MRRFLTTARQWLRLPSRGQAAAAWAVAIAVNVYLIRHSILKDEPAPAGQKWTETETELRNNEIRAASGGIPLVNPAAPTTPPPSDAK